MNLLSFKMPGREFAGVVLRISTPIILMKKVESINGDQKLSHEEPYVSFATEYPLVADHRVAADRGCKTGAGIANGFLPDADASLMAERLYIIGNGFDLHHGVKSSYSQFHQWLVDKYDWRFEDIESHFNTVNLWKDLECEMARFDYEGYARSQSENCFEDMVLFTCFFTDGSGMFRKIMSENSSKYVDGRLRKWHIEIRKAFCEWIRTLHVSDGAVRLPININDALFLSFNYTHVLEDFYGVDQSDVLHVHGEVGDSWEKIQLGHDGQIYRPSYDLTAAAKEDVFDAETPVIQEVRDEVASWQKPVEELVKRNQMFWNRLADVRKIFVLGHSCSRVDLPYFQVVAGRSYWWGTEWVVNCYSDNDVTSATEHLNRCGVRDFLVTRNFERLD